MVILTGDKQGIEFEFAPVANTSPMQFRISLAAVLEKGGRMTVADMPGAAGKPETAPESGVCRLDGDTLVVAMTLGKDESGPPADFTVVAPKKPGEPGVGVMRLTRTAEKPDDVLPASVPATPRPPAGTPPTTPSSKVERFPMTGPATELQGVWTVDSVETGDAEQDARGKAANGQIRMVVHGNVLAFARIGFVEVFNFTLDPAATPRKLTLTENRRLSTDPRRGTPEQETAIYKLDGNKLTIATAPGPNPPADFAAPPAGGSVVTLTKADEPPDALLTFVYEKAQRRDPPRYAPPATAYRTPPTYRYPAYPTGRAYSTYPSRGFPTFPARPQTGKK